MAHGGRESIARTEALFREVNERIAESTRRFDGSHARFLCECGDPLCTDRIEATLDDYERVRAAAATFMVRDGHAVAGIEEVLDPLTDGASVVEKTEPEARRIVEELDPRD